MSTFVGKQIERGILATMQRQTYEQVIADHSLCAATFDPNLDSQLDCYSWILDPSHPDNHPGAKLVRVN